MSKLTRNKRKMMKKNFADAKNRAPLQSPAPSTSPPPPPSHLTTNNQKPTLSKNSQYPGEKAAYENMLAQAETLIQIFTSLLTTFLVAATNPGDNHNISTTASMLKEIRLGIKNGVDLKIEAMDKLREIQCEMQSTAPELQPERNIETQPIAPVEPASPEPAETEPENDEPIETEPQTPELPKLPEIPELPNLATLSPHLATLLKAPNER